MARTDPKAKRSTEELRKLQGDLRKLSRDSLWNQRIKAELKGPVRDAERKLKARIQAIPSKGQNARKGRRSLRQDMVQAVSTNVDTSREYTGGFIWVDARKMPAGRDNLPAYMEGVRRYTRWRHQVFGSEQTWVTQPAKKYFYRTLKPFEKVAADVAEKVIGQAGKDLSK